MTKGSAWATLLAGVLLAVIGGVLATQGMLAVGLTGSIVALAGLYLIALGAWGIHRGALAAIAVITALALPALLTLSWVRTKLWGTMGKGASGLVLGRPSPAGAGSGACRAAGQHNLRCWERAAASFVRELGAADW